MGYRSEVFYGAEFEDEAKARAAVTAAKLKFGDEWDMGLRIDGSVLYFHETYIKWYDDDPFVQFIIELFTFFGDELGAGCVFHRIGDDTEDMDYDENFDGHDRINKLRDVYIVRELAVPFGGEKI